MPWPAEDPAAGRAALRNRAWLLLPDGRRIAQDKLCLTPVERNPAGWNLTTGRPRARSPTGAACASRS